MEFIFFWPGRPLGPKNHESLRIFMKIMKIMKKVIFAKNVKNRKKYNFLRKSIHFRPEAEILP